MNERIVKLRWIGDTLGQLGLPGIPGRDLDSDEVKEYGEKELLETGLWETASGHKNKSNRKDDVGDFGKE